MVDEIGSQSPEDAPGGPKRESSIAMFPRSSTGRLIIGGVALFIVLVAVGAFAFFFLLNPGSQKQTPAPKAKTTSQPTVAAAPPVNPPEASLKDTFTFRNVFIPSVHPPTAEEAAAENSSTSETSTTDTGSTTASTLTLESIVTDSGVRIATFTWKGVTYECVKGDQVDDSPWEVLEIYSDSVLMLYGDSRITLAVGQGYTTTTEPVGK